MHETLSLAGDCDCVTGASCSGPPGQCQVSTSQIAFFNIGCTNCTCSLRLLLDFVLVQSLVSLTTADSHACTHVLGLPDADVQCAVVLRSTIQHFVDVSQYSSGAVETLRCHRSRWLRFICHGCDWRHSKRRVLPVDHPTHGSLPVFTHICFPNFDVF